MNAMFCFSFHNSLSLLLCSASKFLDLPPPTKPLITSPACLDLHHLPSPPMVRRRPFQPAATLTTALAFLLFSFISSSQHPDARSGINDKVLIEVNDGQRKVSSLTEEFERVARRLIGPGSSPPSCLSKCGRCAPCRPVHVPIQPRLNRPLEYYPEAWRCKCGSSLFMP